MRDACRINGWSGRDVDQEHRVSTPLELFCDLTFAVSLAAVANVHLLAVFAALLSSGISMLAFCWAWMSYSWFASAYDADDLTFRLATMVHMVGVIVFCGGPTAAFSIHC